MHHGTDYTPYEGFAVTGWPVSTMVRGRFVVRDGALVGTKAGRYVSREKSPLACRAGTARSDLPKGAPRYQARPSLATNH